MKPNEFLLEKKTNFEAFLSKLINGLDLEKASIENALENLNKFKGLSIQQFLSFIAIYLSPYIQDLNTLLISFCRDHLQIDPDILKSISKDDLNKIKSYLNCFVDTIHLSY